MATIAITEKHKREMSPERDFPGETPVTQRYAILSSPRSGSTLLGRFLHETKVAGDPQEYFNPPLIALERQRSGNEKLNMNQFLRLMEKRRTSPNGVFGLKTHYSQLLGIFRTRAPNQNIVNFLRKVDKLIWIRRRDRLGQAISQAVAMRTNVWSSEDSRFDRNPKVEVHPYECVAALHVVTRDDAGWETLIRQAGLNVHEVWYEDLVADYEGEGRRVLKFLGLNEQVPSIPQQPIEKQSGELNERLRHQVHAYLGLPPVA
ncbi:MAG TPA: Stf0 family sulfotransferase [Ramlibacter sp.]|nr:Stf0 family sulfotransferase [Ramlibacter sp.]